MANFKIDPAVLPESYINVTYNQLLSKVNSGMLIPGALYRITDYLTSVNFAQCISAGHPFDIIVQALDANTLSENASAIQHEGDTYFANSNLSAWKLKYTLSNNTSKYAWANTRSNFEYKISTSYFSHVDDHLDESIDITLTSGTTVSVNGYMAAQNNLREIIVPSESWTNLYGTYYYRDLSSSSYLRGTTSKIQSLTPGRGVIYYMQDEFGNEAPYDFKNIQYAGICSINLMNDSTSSLYISDHNTRTLAQTEMALDEEAINLDSNWMSTSYTRGGYQVFQPGSPRLYTFSDLAGNDQSLSGNVVGNKIVYNRDKNLPRVVVRCKGGAFHNKFIDSWDVYLYGPAFFDNQFTMSSKIILQEYSESSSWGNVSNCYLNSFIGCSKLLQVGGGGFISCTFNDVANGIFICQSHCKANTFLGNTHGQWKMRVNSWQQNVVTGGASDISVFGGYLLACVWDPWSSHITLPLGDWTERYHFRGSSNLHIQYANSGTKFYNSVFYPSQTWPQDEDGNMMILGNTDKSVTFEYKTNNSQTVVL